MLREILKIYNFNFFGSFLVSEKVHKKIVSLDIQLKLETQTQLNLLDRQQQKRFDLK